MVSKLGIFSADLTSFLTECDVVEICQYDAYSNRYDGLALGHWIDLVAPATAASISNTGATAITAGN